jgi:CBS domain-containing protein
LADEHATDLIGAIAGRLAAYPPFDAMDAAALNYLARHAELTYHPQAAEILAPESGLPSYLYIVKQGAVRVQQSLARLGGGTDVLVLGDGECFSITALMEKRAVTGTYVAVADTFCYCVARSHFERLIELSAPFRDFCTDRMAVLLRQSRSLLAQQYAASVAERQSTLTALRRLIRRAPVACSADAPVRIALELMHANKVGSVVAVDDARHPTGILTEHDVLGRVTLARADLEAPLRSIMTANPVCLDMDNTANDAALAMARHGIRHVVVTESQQLAGVITERDLFALQRVSMRQINRDIERAAGLAGFQQAARDIRSLTEGLLGQGVGAAQLTSMICSLNDTLTRRIVEFEAAAAPMPGDTWCWLAFGSEGRIEQTLATDQDNGIVFADAADTPEFRARLLACASRVNDALDACGFPLCDGGIMARNPELCLPLAAWRERFAAWIGHPHEQALLKASIYFDLRAIAGSAALADALREHLVQLAPQGRPFLYHMARNALVTTPPLGLVREFAVDDDGMIDLKKSGARIITDAARVFALMHGVPATNTVQRLRLAGPAMNMPADEIEAAVSAFDFVQTLRLRHQHRDAGKDRGDANRIDPYRLNEVDRRMLKVSLRQAGRLQSRMKLDFQL